MCLLVLRVRLSMCTKTGSIPYKARWDIRVPKNRCVLVLGVRISKSKHVLHILYEPMLYTMPYSHSAIPISKLDFSVTLLPTRNSSSVAFVLSQHGK